MTHHFQPHPKFTPAPKKPRKQMRHRSAKKAAHLASVAGREGGTKDCMFVSEVLRQFARGKECQMKSEWCNGDPETTCLCHGRRRTGTGMGQKPHDFWAYHGCSGCHGHEHLIEDRELCDAIRRTQWVVFSYYGTLTP